MEVYVLATGGPGSEHGEPPNLRARLIRAHSGLLHVTSQGVERRGVSQDAYTELLALVLAQDRALGVDPEDTKALLHRLWTLEPAVVFGVEDPGQAPDRDTWIHPVSE